MKKLDIAFIERMRATHADAEELLLAIDREPWLSVRWNPCKEMSRGRLPMGESVAWCGDGQYLTERPQFTLMPEFHAGAFYVQEASSMFLSQALAAVLPQLPASPVCLDLCAAPGGKTTLLMSRVCQSGGTVVANEVVRTRAWVLRENVAKWGLPGAMVTNRTPEEISASGARFDLITVDAPCSGEGMFRKDDVAVSEWSVRLTDECTARSRKILTDIWPALKTGGFLIYSTCTFNPGENEEMMQWAVEELGAECVPLSTESEWGITTLPYEGGEGYAFYPHKVKGEGLFMCVLRKTTATTEAMPSKKKRQPVQAPKETTLGKEWTEGLRHFVMGEEIVGLPTDRATVMLTLAAQLSPLMTGTPVGSVLMKKGSAQLTPAAELAFSTNMREEACETADVDEETALKFLHGDTDLQLDYASMTDGWVVVRHGGLRLGFVKKMGNRINNYYPKEWRIKMNIAGKS